MGTFHDSAVELTAEEKKLIVSALRSVTLQGNYAEAIALVQKIAGVLAKLEDNEQE